MQKKFIVLKLAMMVAAFAFIVWGFQAMIFSHAPDVFRAKEEDMSFGWYVPLFSLYVVWTARKEILASAADAALSGFALLLPSLLIGFIGARGLQVRFEIFAFASLMVAVPWIFFGGKVAKKLLFPAAFLLFCIPLATFLDVVTVHLRLFVTSQAYNIMHAIGAGVVRRGTMIASAAEGGFEIDVAEPCSGLRSIFALMALTAGYAYYNQPTWLRRAVLFSLSIPIAVFGNILRILSICLVANYASKNFAVGFYHDYSGYIVFIAAIAIMVGAGELVALVAEKTAKKKASPGEDKLGKGGDGGNIPSAKAACANKVRDVSICALALAIIAFSMVYQAKTGEATVARTPDCHLAAIPSWECQKLEASEAEKQTLPGDTRIEKMQYVSPRGDMFNVTLVVGGKSKSSIHRPELCLPAQGYLMKDPRTLEIGSRPWRVMNVEIANSGTMGFAYTFFNESDFRTASHSARIFRDMLDRTFRNRIDRWVMVTVYSTWSDTRSLAEFLSIVGKMVEIAPEAEKGEAK